MRQKGKENWKNMRTIGKYRFIILVGGFWTGLSFLFTALLGLWPDGEFVNLVTFLMKTLVWNLVGGMLFGLIIWVYSEHAYLKSINKSSSNA